MKTQTSLHLGPFPLTALQNTDVKELAVNMNNNIPQSTLLKAHSTSEHSTNHETNKQKICDICKKKFPSQTLLKHHQRVHIRPYQCDHCYQSFRLSWQCQAHSKIHKVHQRQRLGISGRVSSVAGSSKRTRLNEVGDKASSSSESDEMETIKRKIRNLACTVCNVSFQSHHDFLHHMTISCSPPTVDAQLEKENLPSNKKFSCKSCKMYFAHYCNFKLHLARGSCDNLKEITCDICHKSFLNNILLRRHNEKKHGTVIKSSLLFHTNKCIPKKMTVREDSNDEQIRKKVFDTPNTNGKKSFLSAKMESLRCELCQKSFKLVAQMKRHLTSVHCIKSSDAPTCKHCLQDFESLNDLKWHLMEHEDQFKKSFHCKHCQLDFGQLSQLTEHLKSHAYKPHSNSVSIDTHIDDLGESTVEGICCNVCPTFFTDRLLYKAHGEENHGKHHPYQCPNCFDNFEAECQLTIHSLDHGADVPPHKRILPRTYSVPDFICKINNCGIPMNTKGFDSCWRLHQDQCHIETHPYKCENCYFRFETKDEFEIHKKTHRGRPPVFDMKKIWMPDFQCNLCKKTFQYRGPEGSYIDHMNNCHKDVQIRCEICDDRFLEKSELEEHMQDHEDNNNMKPDDSTFPKKRFHCINCNAYFHYGRNSYKQHSDRFHSATHPHRCDVCFDRFESEVFLKIHSRVHGALLTEKEKIVPRVYKVPQFQCQICKHNFTEKGWDSEYRFHMDQLHVNSHPFRCDICVERFMDSAELSWHQQFHVSNEPAHDPLLTHVLEFKCNVCQQPGFIYRGPGSQYRKHQDDCHEKTHPFQCEICFDCFDEETELKRHEFDVMHLHPFRCNLCPTWGFVTWGPDSPYKKHQDQCHSTTYQHQCERCHDGFEYQYELYEHIREGHKNLRQRLMCSYWSDNGEKKDELSLGEKNISHSRSVPEKTDFTSNKGTDLTQNGEEFDVIDGALRMESSVVLDLKNKEPTNPTQKYEGESKVEEMKKEKIDQVENVAESVDSSLKKNLKIEQYADGVAESGQGLLDFIGNLVIDINAEKAMSTDESCSSIESSQLANQKSDVNASPDQGNSIFTCNQCGRVFTRKASYSRHLKFHSGIRPYSCHFCERRFIQSSDLKRHIHTHTGEKTHLCVRCGLKFLHLTQLHRHRKKCTGELNLPPEPKPCRTSTPMTLIPESKPLLSTLPYRSPLGLNQASVLTAMNGLMMSHLNSFAINRSLNIDVPNMPVFPRSELMSPISPAVSENKGFKSQKNQNVFSEDSDYSNSSTDMIKSTPDTIKLTVEKENILSSASTPGEILQAATNFGLDEPDGLKIAENEVKSQSNSEIDGGALVKSEVISTSQMSSYIAESKVSSMMDKPPKNTCKICGRIFNCQNNLARHIRAHTGEKPHGCKYCGKRFIQSSDLKRHIGIHTGQMPFKCAICQQQFVHKHRYLQHLERHGVDFENMPHLMKARESDIDCGDTSIPVTASATKDKIRLSILKKLYPSPGNDPTEISEEVAQMAVSSLDMSGSDEPICDVDSTRDSCGELSASFDELEHKSDVNDSGESKDANCIDQGDGKKQTFDCQYCGKVFKFHALLARHIPKHTGERAFRCSICNKGFIQTSDLKRHMLRHNGYTPHMCQLCYKEFVFEDRLLDHYRTAHKMTKNWIHEQMPNTQLLGNNNLNNIEKFVPQTFVDRKMNIENVMNNSRHPIPLNSKFDTNQGSFPMLSFGSRPDDWKVQMPLQPSVTFNSNMNIVAYPTLAARLQPAHQGGITQEAPLDLSMKVRVKSPKSMLNNMSDKPPKSMMPLTMKENTPLLAHKTNAFDVVNGKSSHKCEVCGREFPLLTSLRRHMMSHAGERQVFCHLCGQGFLQVSELSKHMKLHLSPPLNFKCTVCNAEFSNHQRLAHHTQIFHRGYESQLGNLTRENSTNSNDFLADDASGRDVVDGLVGVKMITKEQPIFDFQKTSTPFRMKFSSSASTMTPPSPVDFSQISNSSSDESQSNMETSNDRKHAVMKPKKAPYKRPRGIYPCEHCGRIFPYKAALVRHVRVHTGERPYKCHECGHGFIQSSDLKRHLAKHSEKNFNCVFCPQSFSNKDSLDYHNKLVHGIDLGSLSKNVHSQLESSTEHVESKSRLVDTTNDYEMIGGSDATLAKQSRQSSITPQPNYVNRNVTKSGRKSRKGIPKRHVEVTDDSAFVSGVQNIPDDDDFNDELVMDLDVKTGGYDEPDGLVIPNSKPDSLNASQLSPLVSKGNSTEHDSMEIDENHNSPRKLPLQIPVLKRIENAKTLPESMDINGVHSNLTTLSVLPFADQDDVENKSHIVNRLTIHASSSLTAQDVPKPNANGLYECTYCVKTFRWPCLLTRHVRKHTGEKPFPCSVCNKTFLQSSDLKRHMYTHSGNKPYKCSICNMEFVQRAKLLSHLKKHGQTDENSLPLVADLIANLPNGNTKFHCKFCKKKFRNEITLAEHMADHKLFRCRHCNMTYLSIQELQMHEATHSSAMNPSTIEPVQKLDESSTSQYPSYTSAAVFPGQIIAAAVSEAVNRENASYLCSKCDKFFDNKVQYDIHVKSCSGA